MTPSHDSLGNQNPVMHKPGLGHTAAPHTESPAPSLGPWLLSPRRPAHLIAGAGSPSGLGAVGTAHACCEGHKPTTGWTPAPAPQPPPRPRLSPRPLHLLGLGSAGVPQ